MRRKRSFTDAELATFIRWLPRSPYSRTVRDALALVLFTGCRSGEVVAALRRDIDLERAVWTIRDTKNGEPHAVMLPSQAVELLKTRRALHDTFVFPSPMGEQHVGQKALGLAQYEARKETKDEPRADPIEVAWTVHDLRRTAATGLAKLGCPRVVQDRTDYLASLTVRNVIPLRAGQQAEGLPISSRRVPASPARANEARD